MDFDLLRSFLKVVECGNFTSAARQLGLTQPGVSRQIAKLELALGATLLLRTRRAVQLTPAGERVLEFGREVLDLERELRAKLNEGIDAVVGRLEIVSSTTPGEFLVPSYLPRFVERHPLVKPELTILDSAAVVEEVLARHAEIGFVGVRTPNEELRYVQIATDEVVLAVPRTHPFADREAVALDELAGQPFVEREGGSGTSMSVRQALDRLGLELPPHRVVMVVNTVPAMLSAIQRGYGLGFVSSIALVDRQPSLVAPVRIEGVDLRRALYLVHESRRKLSLAVRAFIAFVLEGSSPRSSEPQPDC